MSKAQGSRCWVDIGGLGFERIGVPDAIVFVSIDGLCHTPEAFCFRVGIQVDCPEPFIANSFKPEPNAYSTASEPYHGQNGPTKIL